MINNAEKAPDKRFVAQIAQMQQTLDDLKSKPQPTPAIITSFKTINTSSTITYNDGCVLVDSTTNTITVTLPAASTCTPGTRLLIIDNGHAASHNITISRSGSDTINGGTSKTINANYGKVNLVTDGVSAWYDTAN